MDAIYVVAIILSVACASLGLAASILVIRLIPIIKQLEEINQSIKQVIHRIDGVVTNLEGASRGIVAVERRVSGVVSKVMDQVEPEVRRVTGLVAGVRTAVSFLMAGSRGTTNGWTKGTGTETETETETERRLP